MTKLYKNIKEKLFYLPSAQSIDHYGNCKEQYQNKPNQF